MLATFLAVVVALFSWRWRNWISPPRLAIDFASEKGFQGTLFKLDPATNRAITNDAIWYHIRVQNLTRGNPVTGVYVFLLQIEAPDAAGVFKPIWDGGAALGWRHEPNQQPKTIGHLAECDFCYIVKDQPPQIRLNPLVPGQAPNLFTGQFQLIFTMQAKGVEADSNRLRIKVSWNGQWSDIAEERSRNLVFEQLS
jgi:hypothetical protein